MKAWIRFAALAFICASALFFSAAVYAQVLNENDVAAVEGLTSDVDELDGRLTAEIDTLTDEELVEFSLSVDELLLDADSQIDGLSARLNQVEARLELLGEPPAEGQTPEPEIVASERAALDDERARINQLLGVLDEQATRLDVAAFDIADARRALFSDQISQRYNIGEAFSSKFVDDAAELADSLQSRIGSWLGFTWRFKSNAVLAAAASIVGLLLVVFWVGRQTVFSWIKRDPDAEAPSYFRRLTTAFWYTVLPTVLVWAFLAASFAILNIFSILRQDIAEIFQVVIVVIGINLLVWRLTKAIFAPQLPNWRLIRISDRAALQLQIFIFLMITIATFDVFITTANSIFGPFVSVTIVKSLVTALAVGGLLLLTAFMRPVVVETEDGGTVSHPWPISIKIALLLFGFGLVIAALGGYIGFARFAAQQIVVTGAVIATMYLGYRAAQAISAEGAMIQTRLGKRMLGEMQLSESNLDQLGLVAGIFMTIVVILIGLPLLALLWGFQPVEVQGFFYRFMTDIKVGSISISLVSIFVGVILFIVGLFVTRRFQRWLDGNVLARSNVESGARNSISTAIGYVGVAIAGLLGVSAAGFELSQLALVAGALSLGIGFGLQNIVSNFVSGLILLAERPFKAGDIIEAGGFTGVVRNVKVRATEIDTFDKKTLVLPNSELINSAVVNWVHKSTLGRIEVPVGVSYDADPQIVYDLLLDIAKDHPRVLADPEPFVEFANFGDSSLDFVLRAFLADVGFGLTVRTELRIAIYQRFKAAGIEIPFPQRDVNLRIVDGEAGEAVKQVLAEDFDVIRTSKKRQLDDE